MNITYCQHSYSQLRNRVHIWQLYRSLGLIHFSTTAVKSFFLLRLGLPQRGLGEQSLGALIFPAPYPRTAFASGGYTPRSVQWLCCVLHNFYRKSRSGWKLRAVCIDGWFAKRRMFSIVQSSISVALACSTSHLNSMKQGHSLSMWGKVSSSSSQNLQVGEICLILLCT